MWSNRQIEDEVNLCERRNLQGVFQEYLPKDQPILEAGCGLCAWLIKLTNAGYLIEGIDFDDNVVNRVHQYNPTLRVSERDVTKTGYDANSFGGYVSLGVVEHFEDGPGEALAEAYRILKPGGIMILTVPINNLLRRLIYNNLRHIYVKVLKLKRKHIHFVEYRFNKSEIVKYVQDAKFEIIETGYDDFFPKTQSMGLYTDWPFLRARTLFDLNGFGKILAAIVPKKMHSCGIYIVARKPC